METQNNSHSTDKAAAFMLAFARDTGLDSDRPSRRYLWTDAFAVCNFLGLAHATGEQRYTDLALKLVNQVHHVLGKYREDDGREGWISGLDDASGEAHPTRGGLRIGKQLPERAAGEPLNQQLEWERDGQYFHYLTRWMVALDQVSRATGEPKYNLWARELAKTAHEAFTYRAPGHAPQMYWKMSIDLTRPQVSSMGQHDPLDGYITALELEITAAALHGTQEPPDLEPAVRDYAGMLEIGELATADPLGIGGLLVDAWRLSLLMEHLDPSNEDLLAHLLAAARAGLEYYARSGELNAPVSHRLAFRELGLAIGLHALEVMRRSEARGRIEFAPRIRTELDGLGTYLFLENEIEKFWLEAGNRDAASWLEHPDINAVMLATALAPEGFLGMVGGP